MTTKDRLLSHLKREKGNWVSGEYLSGKMGISRSAVWKQVSRLREAGYGIQSSPKKGYLLAELPEVLLPAEIDETLGTRVFGRKEIIYSSEIDSTNMRARSLALQGAPEGTLVVAEKQTMGRGRLGRSWFSPFQTGIYASLILRPRLVPNEAPKITLLAGVSAAETLLAVASLDAGIKWPNDILVHGKKIAGILTETSMEMDAIQHVVVGLGLNVNQRSFPGHLKGSATSLFMETGRPFERVVLLREFLRQFERCYDTFSRVGFEPIRKRWRELAVLLGKEVTVRMMDRTFEGRAMELDRDGALIVKDRDGQSQRIYSGDIRIH